MDSEAMNLQVFIVRRTTFGLQSRPLKSVQVGQSSQSPGSIKLRVKAVHGPGPSGQQEKAEAFARVRYGMAFLLATICSTRGLCT